MGAEKSDFFDNVIPGSVDLEGISHCLEYSIEDIAKKLKGQPPGKPDYFVMLKGPDET